MEWQWPNGYLSLDAALTTLRSSEDEDEVLELEALAQAIATDIGTTLESLAAENETAIPEYEWKDYCEQLADDLGYMQAGIGEDRNPLLHYIDWDAWAEDVQNDYSSFEWNGTTYYVRSY